VAQPHGILRSGDAWDQKIRREIRGTILALRGDFTHKDFWLIDLKTGAEPRLTQLPTGFDIRDFDLSADKRDLLFDRVEETSTVALIDRTG